MIETILLLVVNAGVSVVTRGIGTALFSKIYPATNRARNAAINKMSKELGPKFPSVNFLEMNFRFDSPTIKKELEKITLERVEPDAEAIKTEMALEISNNWPQYKDSASEIVDTFLIYFEQECLINPDLQGVSLATIIRERHAVTQQVIVEDGEKTREAVMASGEQVVEEMRSLFGSQMTSQETVPLKAVSVVEEKLVGERDDILSLTEKWMLAGLNERIKKLADDTLKLKDEINKEISGSIFRLYGSYVLRSQENCNEAEYWINLANECDPDNHKTLALKAELLLYKNDWDGAEKILNPIAETSKEPVVKIFYTECLSRIDDPRTAFEWLKKQSKDMDDNQIKLNLAIFAGAVDEDAYALDNIEELKKTENPGPYPYLVSAQIIAKNSTPREPFTFSTPSDLDLLSNKNKMTLAIKDLEKGIELLELTAKPKKEVVYSTRSLADLCVRLDDSALAAKHLRRYWKYYLRKDYHAWSIASSIALLNGQEEKAIKRARKAIKLYSKDDFELHLRLATIYLNMEEWSECLKVIDSIDEKKLDKPHLQSKLQMEQICAYGQNNVKRAEEAIKALKKQFPKNEDWVLHKALFFEKAAKIKDAIKSIEEVESSFPDSLKIKLRLASLYQQDKNPLRAIALYKEIAHMTKNVIFFERACTLALNTAYNGNEILSIIDEADEDGVTSDNLSHLKAVALTIKNQISDALALFISFPEGTLNHNDYVAFAICYESKTQTDKAIEMLEKGKPKYLKDMRFTQGLTSLYMKTNRLPEAFKEAEYWLENFPDEKPPYLAVMHIGFAIGNQEAAHNAMMGVLSRFGEGPELRSGSVEDLKEVITKQRESSEVLWTKYQEGQIPEVFLSRTGQFGVGGVRINLLNSPARVMSFDGTPEVQEAHKCDTMSAKEVLLDYHALLTISLLELFDLTLEYFETLYIPKPVIDELRNELTLLSTSYQRDRRKVEEKVLSRSKDIFQVIDKFPKTNPNEIPETLGNNFYDLLVCKEKKCTYITSGFNNEELSNINDFPDKIEVLTVLDVVDLMKSNGKISVSQHGDIIEKLKVHKLVKSKEISRMPDCLMFAWGALELLEECGAAEFIDKVGVERYIGPFSISVIRSKIESYLNIDDIYTKLSNLEAKLSELISNDRCKLLSLEEEAQHSKDETLGIKYFDDMHSIFKKEKTLFWTDDIFVNKMSQMEAGKTTSTRTVLDVFLAEGIISQEQFTQKIVQLVKWKMHFCWVNVDIFNQCAKMYDYSLSEDLKVLLETLAGEIRNFPNRPPNQIEMTNLNVAIYFMSNLWIVSAKAQKLSLLIFDDILHILEEKDVLRMLWVSRCIMCFATLDEVVLGEFLTHASHRLIIGTKDELLEAILISIEAFLTNKKREGVVVTTYSEKGAVTLIKAVKKVLPLYESGCTSRALELNPAIKILL